MWMLLSVWRSAMFQAEVQTKTPFVWIANYKGENTVNLNTHLGFILIAKWVLLSYMLRKALISQPWQENKYQPEVTERE